LRPVLESLQRVSETAITEFQSTATPRGTAIVLLFFISDAVQDLQSAADFNSPHIPTHPTPKNPRVGTP
jgi:hypothetical protein